MRLPDNVAFSRLKLTCKLACVVLRGITDGEMDLGEVAQLDKRLREYVARLLTISIASCTYAPSWSSGTVR